MILQRNIMKKYTNKVRHTLRLGGSWNLVTLNSRVEKGGWRGGGERGEKQKNIFRGVVLLGRYSLGRRCPIGHPFKLEMEDFKNFHIPWWDSYCYIQSYLVILLPLWGQLGECLYPSTHYEYKTSLYKWIWIQVLNRKIAFLFH